MAIDHILGGQKMHRAVSMFVLALALTAGATAQQASVDDGASSLSLTVGPCQQHDAKQEAADTELLMRSLKAMQSGGVKALGKLMPKVEKALARAPNEPSVPEQCGDTINVYSSSLADFLILSATLQAADIPGSKNIVQYQPLPYAQLYFVATWNAYEHGDFDEAARLAAAGLTNDPRDVALASEYANVLEIAGQNKKALAFVDTFIASSFFMDDAEEAIMLRRRGYAQGELGRHDEAIATYEQSLKLEPNNKNGAERNRVQQAAEGQARTITASAHSYAPGKFC